MIPNPKLEGFRQRQTKRESERKKLEKLGKSSAEYIFVPPKELIASNGRADLTQMFCECEISLEEAEAEAARLGFEPILPQPPASAFDPAKETFWSYPMIVAWVAWQDMAKVRDQFDAFRAASREFYTLEFQTVEKEKRCRQEIRALPPATCNTLEMYDAKGWESDHRKMSVADARRAIHASLCAVDGLKARARPLNLGGLGNPREIPTAEWSSLGFWDDPRHACIGLRFDDAARSVYLKPMFYREQVMAIWPRRVFPVGKWPKQFTNEILSELQPKYGAFAAERIKTTGAAPTEADDRAWVIEQLDGHEKVGIARTLRANCDLPELHTPGRRKRRS